jgi:hypothetical protein
VSSELLPSLPPSDLRIYAVWMPILRSDGRLQVDPGLVPDPRATRWWDEGMLTGLFFKGRPEFSAHDDFVVWDAYGLYGKRARWEPLAAGPSDVVATGWTIIAEAEKLRFALLTELAAPWPRVFLPRAGG